MPILKIRSSYSDLSCKLPDSLKNTDMKSKTILFAILTCITTSTFAQIDARLLQQPDVSDTHITFVYAGDVWTVNKSGGVATRLSSPIGVESFPKFSPDGKHIAFSANYHGNVDVYVVPVSGGMPKRLTQHSAYDRVLDWHPDGKHVLFASGRESGRQRFSQFYLIASEGGMASKLPVPYGEFGSFSPDGRQLAYTDKSRVFRTWKRYRGGTAPDITIMDLHNLNAEVVIDSDANDEIPMWLEGKIYFLSDRGVHKRGNIWSYDPTSKALEQLTHFTDYDVRFPSAGPQDIVFEAGGKLYLLNLAEGQAREVTIEVVTDQLALQPKLKGVMENVASAHPAFDGKRVVVEARGELFSVPAEKGYVENLTQTSGVAERYPAWSPDGRYIAYWSDRSGEYELTLLEPETGKEQQLTNYGPGFRYKLYWSPDSKKLAFVDKAMTIKIYEVDNKRTIDVDQATRMFEGRLRGFSVSWSADSKWMAYSKSLPNSNQAVFVFDLSAYNSQQLTSGYYSVMQPVFDPDGKYLFVLTNRSFSPSYSDFDNSFVYSNATQLAAISLRKDVLSLLSPENDAVEPQEEDDEQKEDAQEAAKPEKKKKKGKGADAEDEKTPTDEGKSLEIDAEDFESRMVLLPEPAGNFGNIYAVAGKLIYHKAPNTGDSQKEAPIKFFDLEERESKTIIGDADGFVVSANGEKLLVSKGKNMAVVSVAEGQKMDKPLNLAEMNMTVNPREEWNQIFRDAWRLERDFFYDEGMHGVDWDEMYVRYSALLEDAATRDDVNFIIGELIGELNASHTYRGGGDREQAQNMDFGYLGVDYQMSDGFYRIGKIYKGAPWDIEAKSPLDMPGVEASEGDYLLAVNGVPVDASREPYFAFEGLAGKTVQLTLNTQPIMAGSRKVIVETMRSGTRLRHLSWIEANRKMIDEATDGKVGYVYVRSTGIDGQNELVRQFMAQWDKEGLIIDERFNSGGQIPDRFIELLNRKPLAFWSVRDGKDWQWPPIAHFGPKVMLINGWSGSGGDAFPDYFRKAGLGPLIGSRTWGGLIGISGAPQLIDGGIVTVPTFRMYDPDGAWFKEGHGVDPDIEVHEDATTLAKGGDAQIEKAISVIMELIEQKGFKKPVHPAVEER
jgi:tricorn protease